MQEEKKKQDKRENGQTNGHRPQEYFYSLLSYWQNGEHGQQKALEDYGSTSNHLDLDDIYRTLGREQTVFSPYKWNTHQDRFLCWTTKQNFNEFQKVVNPVKYIFL